MWLVHKVSFICDVGFEQQAAKPSSAAENSPKIFEYIDKYNNINALLLRRSLRIRSYAPMILKTLIFRSFSQRTAVMSFLLIEKFVDSQKVADLHSEATSSFPENLNLYEMFFD